MKLVTFEVGTSVGRFERIGALIDNNRIVDLTASYAYYLSNVEGEIKPHALAEVRIPPKMISFLEGEEKSMEAARNTLDYMKTVLSRGNSSGLNGEKLVYNRADIKLLAPLPRPNSLRDFMCFEEHLQDAAKRDGFTFPKLWYEIIVCYKGNHCSVAGPEDDIYYPNFDDAKLDYEFEIGMCIGKKGKNIPLEEASQYIAGYTIFIDLSERNIQFTEQKLNLGPFKGKDFDHGNIMGPCLVTPDELDFSKIKATVRINDEFQVEGNTSQMYWSWEQLIAYTSRSMTLYPGDIFGSGTIGLCSGDSTNRKLKPGDILEFEATGIGVIRNKVVRI